MNGSGASVGASTLLLDECAVLVLVSVLPLQGGKLSRLLHEPHKPSTLLRLAAERPG